MNASRRVMTVLFLGLCAVALVLIGGYLIRLGFHTMFTYGNYDSTTGVGDPTGHIVGGDAYNYIIIGIRGLGFITAGVGAEIMGAIFSVGAFLVGNAIQKQKAPVTARSNSQVKA